MGHGRRSWTRCVLDATRPKGRIGRSAWTRPSPARISTRPEPGTLSLSTSPQGAVSNDKSSGTDDAGKGHEALGRSRGGLTTKIHMVADRRCRPIARLLTGGQRGDAPRFIAVMDIIRIARRGPGRPRTRPGRAMGDKAHSSKAIRSYLRRRGIKTVIPVKEDQKKHRLERGRAGGRPPVFDTEHYKQRNTVERCFSKLKQFQAVATRYDKTSTYLPGHR
jgi:transposase